MPWDLNLKEIFFCGSGLATYCPSIGMKSAQKVLGSSVRILGLALEERSCLAAHALFSLTLLPCSACVNRAIGAEELMSA